MNSITGSPHSRCFAKGWQSLRGSRERELGDLLIALIPGSSPSLNKHHYSILCCSETGAKSTVLLGNLGTACHLVPA